LTEFLDIHSEKEYTMRVLTTASGRAIGDSSNKRALVFSVLVELIVAVVLPELDQDTDSECYFCTN